VGRSRPATPANRKDDANVKPSARMRRLLLSMAIVLAASVEILATLALAHASLEP